MAPLKSMLAGTLLAVSLANAVPAPAQQGTLRVHIVDSDSGEMTAARAWVESAGKRHFEPAAPETCTPYPRDRSFSCDGEFTFHLDAGSATIHVEKGKAWLPVETQAIIKAGAETLVDIQLVRWVDMAAAGWFSADLHVHFGHDQPRVLRQLALADDLNLVPAFSSWLRGTEKIWPKTWPAWPGGPVIAVDSDHFITRDNLEIERISRQEPPGGSVGATFIFNLDRPLSRQRFDPRFPSDASLVLAARADTDKAVVDADKPSWAETTVGAALGVYDTAQLCHNHYHREATLPGGWGMIGPLDDGERALTEPDELFHRSSQQYYRWLNCGIRMAVSGGSAMGVMPVPMGYNRTYAKIEGEFTPDSYWAAVKAGRTFATSGPMLTMTVDQHEIGDVIRLAPDNARSLEVALSLRSRESIDSLELVQNGRIVHRESLEEKSPAPHFEHRSVVSVTPRRSGWLAARAIFRAPDGRFRQAHTSPVYIELGEKPTASKADADYNHRWIDRLIEIARQPGRYASDADRDQVIAVYQQARDFYRDNSATASQVWGD